MSLPVWITQFHVFLLKISRLNQLQFSFFSFFFNLKYFIGVGWWSHEHLFWQSFPIRRCTSLPIYGIMQHLIAIDTLATSIREVKIDSTIPLHFPSQDSNHPVNEISTLEFSANPFAKVVRPCKALVMVPSGVALFGINVQHLFPSITHTPPFPLTSYLKLFCFSMPSCW